MLTLGTTDINKVFWNVWAKSGQIWSMSIGFIDGSSKMVRAIYYNTMTLTWEWVKINIQQKSAEYSKESKKPDKTLFLKHVNLKQRKNGLPSQKELVVWLPNSPLSATSGELQGFPEAKCPRASGRGKELSLALDA